MDNAIARLTRENHFNNLIDNLPLFTILYGTQCALAHYLFHEIVDPGNFAIVLGLSLIGLLSMVYVYNRYHHIIIFEDKVQVYFEVFNSSKFIHFDDILDILAPKEECEFASISLVLKNDQVYDIHFIDYPVQVRKVLLQYIYNYKNKNQEFEKQAA